MAEPAPLLSAHTHARKAADATQHVNWNIAAEEHQQAAVEFARVAKGTSDAEAFRVLNLLEEQHQKLADMIRSQGVPRDAETATVDPRSGSQPVEHGRNLRTDQSQPISSTTTPTALSTTRFGSQVRDSSPTLARDIASRRGIPQPGRNPPSAAAQARARQLSPESRRRNRGNPPPKIPPSIMDSQSNLRDARSARKMEDDDAFAKFYSDLTTGTMSKLSSVLAYAGLPLSTEDQQADPEIKLKPDRRTVSVNNEPDVKSIFSKAVLDVIEDENRQHGTRGRVFGPAESFYVVQRGGGTYSYADIAKAQQQQQDQQNLAAVDEDDEQDFEDAREAQTPSSPRQSQIANQARKSFGKSRTQEELELENVTLKQTLEQVAQRLSEFESHAQDASMAVLTQSMISNPGVTPESSPALLSRVHQLERQLQEQAATRQKLQSDLEKKDKTLKKYRSTFEEIKKSAKEKDKAKREKAKKDAEDGPAESADAT